MIKTEISPK